jgi:broad specificity phosphatase PhoE
MADSLRLWCLRHGQSENVVSETAGVVTTAPLTELGHRQAATAAQRLGDEDITTVFCSNAVRARETAAYLARTNATEVVVLPQLNEVGIGAAEGATDQATRSRTAEVLRAWVVTGDLDQRVADGESGEEVLARVQQAFHLIAATRPGQVVAVVGHVASLTFGLSVLCGLGGRVWGTPLGHAEPFRVEYDGATWYCPQWPDLAALD